MDKGLSAYDFESEAFRQIWVANENLQLWSKTDYDKKMYALGMVAHSIIEYKRGLTRKLEYRAEQEGKDE